MSAKPGFKIAIASPCSKDWNQMKGTAQKRFCEGCKQHVYDLSAMPWDEVRALLDCDQPPCVKFFQRADGTVLTADCPVGKERARRRLRQWVSAAAAAVLGATAMVRGWLWASESQGCDVSPISPIAAVHPERAERVEGSADPQSDTTWMEERRARLPGERARSFSMGRMSSMGVIRSSNIKVIKGNGS